MKKHFFNVIAALSLVCGVFAFSGCTDFENDINEINDRLDKLETGSIASLEEQIATLTSSLDEAHNLLDLLQGNVEDLQAADDAMSQQIDALNGEIETVKGQISDLNGQISSLEEELNKKIDDAVAELKASDNAAAERISDLESDLAKAKEDLAKAIADGNANKEAIDELKQKVEDYYNELIDAIEKAETSHSEDIARLDGEISSLKEALAEQTQKLTDLIESVSELEKAVEYLEGLTANIPELENLVDSIQENYLSKEEAQNTFATLESVAALLEKIGGIEGRLDAIDSINVSVGERLQDLEDNYADLKDVIIPGLEADILAAQEAAAKAQESADAAMDFAKNVLGELETLRNALGIYAKAGALEAKMEALDAVDSTLKAKDEELAKLIDELDAAVAADIAGLKGNIEDLCDELMDIIDDIKADMVTKDGFDALFKQELNKALAENGEITNAIAAAINEAREELQDNIDDANGRIDILDEALKDLSDDVAAVIEDLANRIQSLVFVPEYKDGMATAYRYYVEGTVEGKTEQIYVSDNYRLQATFQVTPAEAAEQLVQNPERVKVKVLPVLTRSYAEEDCMVIEDVELTLNPVAGRINVDALIPAEKVTVDNYDQLDITVALYVADPAVREGEEASDLDNIDAGSYISSEYVAVGLDENSKLEYALFSGEGTEQKVYKNGASVKEEKSWKDAPAPHTFFEGYQLGVKIAESKDAYVSLAQAESDLKLESGALALDYSNTAKYYDSGNGTNLDYSKVAAADKGIEYTADGYLISAKMTTEDIKVSKNFRHDSLTVNSYFTKEILTGTPPAPVDVVLLTNKAQYEIINQRYTVELNADGTSKSLETWKYDIAKEYKITPANQNPYTFPEVAVVNFEEIQEAEAYNDIRDILNNSKAKASLEYTVNGISDTYERKFNTSPDNLAIAFVAGEIAKIAKVTIDEYYFTQTERKYNAKKTYTIEEDGVEVVFDVTFTLGALPKAQNFDVSTIEDPTEVGLMMGAYYNWQEIDLKPFYQKIYDSAPESFKDVQQVAAYLADDYSANKYVYSEVVTKCIPQLNGGEKKETITNLSRTGKDAKLKHNVPDAYAFLNIVSQGDEWEYGIRLSAKYITSLNDRFEYKTSVTTSAGVTYNFTAVSIIKEPQFGFEYDPVYAPGGNVEVMGIVKDSRYALPVVDLGDYLHIANKGEKITGNVSVSFEILTEEDLEHGVTNIPVLPANNRRIESNDGILYTIEETLLDWSNYTAREIDVKATLWMSVGGGYDQDMEKIIVDQKVLHITTPDPILSFEPMSDVVEIERSAGETTTINLWQYLEAYGIIDGDSKNILKYWEPQQNPKADWREYGVLASIADLNSEYNLAYKCFPELTFPALSDITFEADGKPYNDPDMVYNAKEGTIVLSNDNAVYQNDIKIIVPVSFGYYLDYNGEQTWNKELEIVVKASK